MDYRCTYRRGALGSSLGPHQVEINADVNARVLAFGVSAVHHPTQLKMVFPWNFTFFQNRFVLTQDVIATADALRIQVKMIIDGHGAITKEKCRVIGRGIHILTTDVIPAIETDTLFIALDGMW